MSTITIQCLNPACKARFVVPADLAGRKVRCKECRQSFIASSDGPTTEHRPLADPSMPVAVGRFQVRTRLGAGAFGTVYRAYDPQLDREVAVKVPHPAVLESPKRSERFLREAKAAAGLRHPNIVPVYDSGPSYIASAFITGQPVESLVTECGIEFARAAAIVRKVAEGLAYAHAQGVVHRDIKPANILLEAGDNPLIADFGLAARADDESRLTNDGAIVGTPSYMAPEQAQGQQGEAKPAADQYSVGVLLYELLCGQTPFSGPPAIVLHNAVHTPPEPPSKHRKDIPRDLETICLKAMAKCADDRYPDCQALADDLRRWQESEPIVARRLGLIERAVRYAKKEPQLAAAYGALVAALFVIGLLLVVRTTQLISELQTAPNDRYVSRDLAAAEKDAAEAARQERDDEAFHNGAAQAMLGNALEVERIFAAVPAERRGPDWGLVVMRARMAGEFGQILRRPRDAAWRGGTVGAVFAGPSGRLIAAGEDSTLTAWDVWTGRGRTWGKPPKFAEERTNTEQVLLSGDGKRLLRVISKGGRPGPDKKELPYQIVVTVYEVASGKEIRSWTIDGFWPSAAIDQKGERVALAFAQTGKPHRMGVREVESGELIDALMKEIAPHPMKGVLVAFSPEGSALAATTARDKGELRAWSVPSGEEVIAVENVGIASELAFSPDGKRLAAVGGAALIRHAEELETFVEYFPVTRKATRQVTEYKTEKRKVKKTLKDKDGKECEVEFEQEVQVPTTKNVEYEYTQMDQRRGTLAGPWLSPHVEYMTHTVSKEVAVTEQKMEQKTQVVKRTGKRLMDGKEEKCECDDVVTVTVCVPVMVKKLVCETVMKESRANGGVLRVWDRGGKQTFRVEEPTPIEAIAWRGDGLRLASATAGAALNVASCDVVGPVGMCPNDQPTATVVKLWHSRTARLVTALDRNGVLGVACLAFSPDGVHIAAGLRGRPEVLCWSGESRTLVATRHGHEGGVDDLAFSADGKFLASHSICGRSVRLWDGDSGEYLRALTPASSSAAFAPANLVLTGMPRPGGMFDHGGLAVWNRDTGEPKRLPGLAILAAAATADGARALTRSGQGPVEVRDADTGGVLGKLSGTEGANAQWLLSPSGKRAAAVPFAAPAFGVPGDAVAFVEEQQPRPVPRPAPAKAVPFRVWDADTGKLLFQRNGVASAQFSPDGERLAAVAGGKLLVLDAATGKEAKSIALPPGDGGQGRQIVFLSADRLLTSGYAGMQMYDLAAGKLLARPASFLGVWATSGDGKRLAVLEGTVPVRPWMPGQVGETRSMVKSGIQIYDLADGKKLRRLKVNARWVNDLQFSPDGSLLAYGGHTGAKLDEGVLNVLTVEKGERVASYRGHVGTVNRVAFRPDGHVIASGGADRTVRLWKVPALDLEPLEDDPEPPPMPPMPPGPVMPMPAPPAGVAVPKDAA